MNVRKQCLVAGAVGSGVASALHVGIIIGGAEWYRFFGAGEGMARSAERGAAHPTVITAAIAAILAGWAWYALSGAGVVRRLPLLRQVLYAIAGVYLLRALVLVPAVLLLDDPYLRELGARMWFVWATSIVCLVLGVLYAVGASRVEA